ncbi:NAD(P)-dependent oxidoreductase [Bacteriovoracaceae bacterium]|nr:NAD(P)-dependent oxidoreductase [Bacteriovoracaceae bacterium]
MKVLITGSTGFVGSHLSDLLSEAGHQVYSLARNPNKFSAFNVQGTMIKGDLPSQGDIGWIDELPSDLDAVVHTAGVVHSFNEDLFTNVNALATKNLIENLRSKYSNLKFILVSSLAAVGPSSKGKLHTEECSTHAISRYGKSKLKAEKYLEDLAPKEWSTSIIRPPMVIGPRDTGVLDVFKMVNSRFVLFAGLNAKAKEYSFICVYDLIQVIKKAVETQEKMHNESFFASHPQVITMELLIDMIKSTMNKSTLNLVVPFSFVKVLAHTIDTARKVIPIEFRLTPDKLYELEPDSWTCSGQKSVELLNMNYEWDLYKTIKVTYEDYKERGWL